MVLSDRPILVHYICFRGPLLIIIETAGAATLGFGDSCGAFFCFSVYDLIVYTSYVTFNGLIFADSAVG